MKIEAHVQGHVKQEELETVPQTYPFTVYLSQACSAVYCAQP